MLSSLHPGHFISPPSLIPDTPLQSSSKQCSHTRRELRFTDHIQISISRSIRQQREMDLPVEDTMEICSVEGCQHWAQEGWGWEDFQLHTDSCAPHPPALRADTRLQRMLPQEDDFCVSQPLAQETAGSPSLSMSRVATRKHSKAQGRKMSPWHCPHGGMSTQPQCCPLSASCQLGWQGGTQRGAHGGSPGAGCCES